MEAKIWAYSLTQQSLGRCDTGHLLNVIKQATVEGVYTRGNSLVHDEQDFPHIHFSWLHKLSWYNAHRQNPSYLRGLTVSTRAQFHPSHSINEDWINTRLNSEITQISRSGLECPTFVFVGVASKNPKANLKQTNIKPFYFLIIFNSRTNWPLRKEKMWSKI